MWFSCRRSTQSVADAGPMPFDSRTSHMSHLRCARSISIAGRRDLRSILRSMPWEIALETGMRGKWGKTDGE